MAVSIWVGRVDDMDAYTVLNLETCAWVTRYGNGVRGGFRMTNVERAKDLAELQAKMDLRPRRSPLTVRRTFGPIRAQWQVRTPAASCAGLRRQRLILATPNQV